MSAATMTAATVSRWMMGRNVSASSPFPTPYCAGGSGPAVLPLDKELETALFHRLDAKRCAVCGALFTPSSNRAKYCPECAVQVKPEDEYTVYEVEETDTDEEADLLNFDDLDRDEFV